MIDGAIISDSEINKEAIYFALAKEFGYTRKQVDEMGAREVDMILSFLEAHKRREIANMK